MNQTRSCRICGRFYESASLYDECPLCAKRDSEDFGRIKDYLYLHPLAKVFEVSMNLDIPVSQIKRYLREGRIEIVERNHLFLVCEKCGTPISSGNYCSDCIKHSIPPVKSAFYSGGLQKSSNTKLRYLPGRNASLAKTASK